LFLPSSLDFFNKQVSVVECVVLQACNQTIGGCSQNFLGGETPQSPMD